MKILSKQKSGVGLMYPDLENWISGVNKHINTKLCLVASLRVRG